MAESVSFSAAALQALAQELERDDSVFVYGEGINDPSGFFGSTVGLAERFGEARCFDVPNAEEMLTGFGLGAALSGMRPVFYNLRIEFLLLAVNQLVNHAAKWGAMQGRSLPIPFTAVAMIGRGWGQGAQHSGSYASMFAHVPGLHVVMASGPNQGARLLVGAIRYDAPVLVLQPKAVFDEVERIPDAIEPLPIGTAVVARPGADFTVAAVGDGVRVALRAAEALAGDGIDVEVIDACAFSPLDRDTITRSVERTGAVGVVDVGWDAYGLAAEVAKVVLQSSAGAAVRAPLLSWAPAGHAPAGAFAEAEHYPSVERVVSDIRAVLRG